MRIERNIYLQKLIRRIPCPWLWALAYLHLYPHPRP